MVTEVDTLTVWVLRRRLDGTYELWQEGEPLDQVDWPAQFASSLAAIAAQNAALQTQSDLLVASGSSRTVTLTAQANAGQKNLVVSSITGYNIGDSVFIGNSGGTFESGVIASFGALTITLVANLANTYAIGIPVSRSPVELVEARGGATTLGGRLDRLIFDVKRYGAKGDGVTNDYAAINAACIAADAAGGGVVFFPPGTYICNTGLTPGKTTSLAGVGGTLNAGVGRGSYLKINHGANPGILYSGTNGAPGVGWGGTFTIRDLNIETTGSGPAMRIERCTEFLLENLLFTGVGGGAIGNGIELTDTYSHVASNVRVHVYQSGSAWKITSTGLTQPGQMLFHACMARYAVIGFQFLLTAGVIESVSMDSCVTTDCSSSGVFFSGAGGARNFRLNDLHCEHSSNVNSAFGIFTSGVDIPNLRVDGFFGWGLDSPLRFEALHLGLLVDRVYINTNGHASPSLEAIAVVNPLSDGVEIGYINQTGHANRVNDSSLVDTRIKRFAGAKPFEAQLAAPQAITNAYADIAGLTKTATPLFTEVWEIEATVDVNITVATAGLITVSLLLDGVIQRDVYVNPNNGVGRASVTVKKLVSVTANAAHTAKVQIKKANGTGTATAEAGSTVMFLKRKSE